MSTFLTVEQAAKRVGKSVRTINRWTEVGLTIRGGYVKESTLLEMDKLMRSRRGRPKKTAFGMVVLADIHAERLRQNAKWGEQNHPDGTGPSHSPLYLAEHSGGGAIYPLAGATQLADAFKAATDHAAKEGTVTWADILLEEVFEALAENDPVKLRTELVQVAAVATQWAEAIDRRTAWAKQTADSETGENR